MARRASTTNGTAKKGPVVTNVSQSRDTWVDLQLHSSHVCTRMCEVGPRESGHTKAASEYAKEPWEHSRDPTNTYLGLRYSDRTPFLGKVEEEEKGRIISEENRIEQLRVNFASQESKKDLMECLRTTRQKWKEEASTRRPRPFEEVKNIVTHIEVHEKPLYGLKAGAIHFKQEAPGSGYVGFDFKHPNYSSKFPDQKLSLQGLLEVEKDNPLSAPCGDGCLRYFHLPSNNMRWIEAGLPFLTHARCDADILAPLESHGAILF